MTPEAWAVHKMMREMRRDVTELNAAELRPGHFECGQGREVLFIGFWDRESAMEHLKYSIDPDIIAWGFNDVNFSEGLPGDILITVEIDKRMEDYVYGFDVRTQREGWFPRCLGTLLEERVEDRHGDCCQPFTFKYDGLRLGLDEGLGWLKQQRRGVRDETFGEEGSGVIEAVNRECDNYDPASTSVSRVSTPFTFREEW
ncbi:MAG: hypothetical protein MMC33_008041 [Icmadophila ericetorum]|nr:hypothetical protein [Icmadophila ericetorum]